MSDSGKDLAEETQCGASVGTNLSTAVFEISVSRQQNYAQCT